jgi:hypothetical protein
MGGTAAATEQPAGSCGGSSADGRRRTSWLRAAPLLMLILVAAITAAAAPKSARSKATMAAEYSPWRATQRQPCGGAKCQDRSRHTAPGASCARSTSACRSPREEPPPVKSVTQKKAPIGSKTLRHHDPMSTFISFADLKAAAREEAASKAASSGGSGSSGATQLRKRILELRRARESAEG